MMIEEADIFSITYLTYEVVPFQGIGPIFIGMSREESRAVMREIPKTYKKTPDAAILTDAYDEVAIHVFFDEEDKVEFIEVSSDGIAIFTYKGISVFETKAEELVELISKDAPYDEDDPSLGIVYIFPSLELGLWRPFVPENDEDEWRCFATIGIGKRGYYSSS